MWAETWTQMKSFLLTHMQHAHPGSHALALMRRSISRLKASKHKLLIWRQTSLFNMSVAEADIHHSVTLLFEIRHLVRLWADTLALREWQLQLQHSDLLFLWAGASHCFYLFIKTLCISQLSDYVYNPCTCLRSWLILQVPERQRAGKIDFYLLCIKNPEIYSTHGNHLIKTA